MAPMAMPLGSGVPMAKYWIDVELSIVASAAPGLLTTFHFPS